MIFERWKFPNFGLRFESNFLSALNLFRGGSTDGIGLIVPLELPCPYIHIHIHTSVIIHSLPRNLYITPYYYLNSILE